jgi:hypothetical protein
LGYFYYNSSEYVRFKIDAKRKGKGQFQANGEIKEVMVCSQKEKLKRECFIVASRTGWEHIVQLAQSIPGLVYVF